MGSKKVFLVACKWNDRLRFAKRAQCQTISGKLFLLCETSEFISQFYSFPFRFLTQFLFVLNIFSTPEVHRWGHKKLLAGYFLLVLRWVWHNLWFFALLWDCRLGVCLWWVSHRGSTCIQRIFGWTFSRSTLMAETNRNQSPALTCMIDIPSLNIEKLFKIGLDPGKMEKLDRKCLSSRNWDVATTRSILLLITCLRLHPASDVDLKGWLKHLK